MRVAYTEFQKILSRSKLELLSHTQPILHYFSVGVGLKIRIHRLRLVRELLLSLAVEGDADEIDLRVMKLPLWIKGDSLRLDAEIKQHRVLVLAGRGHTDNKRQGGRHWRLRIERNQELAPGGLVIFLIRFFRIDCKITPAMVKF